MTGLEREKSALVIVGLFKVPQVASIVNPFAQLFFTILRQARGVRFHVMAGIKKTRQACTGRAFVAEVAGG